MTEILDLTGAQAADRVRAGDLDPGDLWRAYRERAERDELNCFTWVSDAETPDEGATDGLLAGVPVGVKDLFCTEGIVSQAGSLILEGYKPPYTATSIQHLIDAGAPVVAKTNQDEFAMGSSNENCAFGPVRNPWDDTRVPGGSSGGSGAALAAGLAPLATGTDGGGSIRTPAPSGWSRPTWRPGSTRSTAGPSCGCARSSPSPSAGSTGSAARSWCARTTRPRWRRCIWSAGRPRSTRSCGPPGTGPTTCGAACSTRSVPPPRRTGRSWC